VWLTYWRLHHATLAHQGLLMLLEIASRVGSPLILRQLLSWLSGWGASGGDASAYPAWQGWMWAALLPVVGWTYTIMHHQLFWKGMRLGMKARQQAITAIQAKVLRLNAVAVGDVTVGKVGRQAQGSTAGRWDRLAPPP
jgi:hypothetical protein